MNQHDTYDLALQKAGYSATAPRRLILTKIAELGPISPAKVALSLNGQVDRASVYRAITLFRSIGFVRDVASGWKQLVELGDQFDPHHHHITCSKCSRSTVIASSVIEGQLINMAKERGYILQMHQLDLTGLCERCK